MDNVFAGHVMFVPTHLLYKGHTFTICYTRMLKHYLKLLSIEFSIYPLLLSYIDLLHTLKEVVLEARGGSLNLNMISFLNKNPRERGSFG